MFATYDFNCAHILPKLLMLRCALISDKNFEDAAVQAGYGMMTMLLKPNKKSDLKFLSSLSD